MLCTKTKKICLPSIIKSKKVENIFVVKKNITNIKIPFINVDKEWTIQSLGTSTPIPSYITTGKLHITGGRPEISAMIFQRL